MTDPRFLSRRTDPHTSHAAAAEVAPTLGRIQAQMFEAFRNAPNGLTPDEAEIAAGLHVGARRRVSELHNAGLIEPNGDTRPGRAGKAQRVFVIVRVQTDLFGGIR
jgi:hypothetical protein